MTTTKLVENHHVPWEQEYGYSQAIRRGNTIHLAGQVAHDADGNLVGEGDMDAQMRQAYANAKTLLERLGATLDDVVDETLYVTDMSTAFAARATLKHEVYGPDPHVASTIVEINRLALPPLMVEIRFVAEV